MGIGKKIVLGLCLMYSFPHQWPPFLPVDKHEIDDGRVYAMVSKDQGRNKDIQLLSSGTDSMGWKPRSACKHPRGGYDEESDIQFFYDEPNVSVPAGPGIFVIFFPEDAHMPLISTGQLHKVVVKVAVDQR